MYQAYRDTFDAFSRGELRSFLEQREKDLTARIQREDDDYLISVGEDSYIAHMTELGSIAPLVVAFDQMSVEDEERMIPAEYFPRNYGVSGGSKYPKTVLVYRVPFTGNEELLGLRPSSYLMSGTPEIGIQTLENGQRAISFENIVFNVENSDEQRNFVEQTKKTLNHFLESQKRDLGEYHARLPGMLRMMLTAEKNKILKKRALVSAIGIPLRKRVDASQTFSIPSPEQKQKILVKPSSGSVPFTPDPTLDEASYGDILKLLEGAGSNMERSPSLYEGKDEEAMRDLLQLVLQSHFEGSATSESFNVKGKTDILLKHKATNIFVAECKIWRGERGFLDAIDQLLSYLTHRDSKTAIIVFVKTKDFTVTMSKMRDAAKKHPHFVTEKNVIDTHGFHSRFTLPTDPGKEISLTVLAFHFPEVVSTDGMHM